MHAPNGTVPRAAKQHCATDWLYCHLTVNLTLGACCSVRDLTCDFVSNI